MDFTQSYQSQCSLKCYRFIGANHEKPRSRVERGTWDGELTVIDMISKAEKWPQLFTDLKR